ncbi:unnamed protein product [Camellia sinensis]
MFSDFQSDLYFKAPSPPPSALAISISLRSLDLNSDPSITRISSSNGGSAIAKPICSICYEDLNPIIEDLQSISICGHVFHKLCLQQCIEYCSNVKKKRCPVCKQAFLEANVSRLYFQSVGNLYQKLINCEDNLGELHREIDHSQQKLTAKCNVLGRGEACALCKLGKAKEKIKKLKARIQELKTAVEVKDNEVSRALKASKKTILEGDALNDVDWNSNSSSISEDLAVEKNCFSRSEAALDTRSEVHRPCNKNGVSGSKSAFWTNEDWETPVSKMVLGKFRHLPIVESGEVIALLNIAKCLYDVIAHMERAAEKGKAIAAAVEGVLTHSLKHFEIECLGLFCLQSFLRIQSRIATVSPADTVLMATKKMVEYGMRSAVVAVENKTSLPIFYQVKGYLDAGNSTKSSSKVHSSGEVMTPNPECATVDTPIVDALHIMHDGKFLHLLVVDKDGVAVAVVDVLHITHAAIATVGSNAGVSNDSSPNMMQNFWDSAMALSPDEEEDAEMTVLSNWLLKALRQQDHFPSLRQSCLIPFLPKFKIRRVECIDSIVIYTRSLTDLVTAILQRVGDEIDRNNLPHILMKIMTTLYLRQIVILRQLWTMQGEPVLKLHLDHSGTQGHRRGSQSGGVEYAQSDVWASIYSALAAGAALIAGLSLLAYLRRNG